ncbi:Ribosomal protein L37 [Caligus rogercresseyi]|uniref:Ribosomal protein L37 n=1 Tax=Caligus rogercresseyi TaxID=217165 RepID=A0A7T8HEZ4_CALRO|nr:Ribosomal protein L37 [Caligus rogercresseyi]
MTKSLDISMISRPRVLVRLVNGATRRTLCAVDVAASHIISRRRLVPPVDTPALRPVDTTGL